MYKTFNYIAKTFPAILIVLMGLVMASCEKDDESAPMITGIRAYLPAPNDTVLSKVGPDTWVVIQGSNLKGTKAVFFDGDGFPATFNSALLAENSIVVLVPAGIPFASVPADQLNTIRIVTDGGEIIHSFPIFAPSPVVAGASNEMANPGEEVVIYGSFLYLIDKVVFPGNIEATGYTSNESGTAITVKVPQGLTEAGPITVQTKFGTGSSVFRFNDFTTGMLADFDNVNVDKMESWSSAKVENNATAFPGGKGKYARLEFTAKKDT